MSSVRSNSASGTPRTFVYICGHVGYGIAPHHRGHGYASAALAKLRPIARWYGFAEIWITCQPENGASCRTLENTGAILEGTVTVEEVTSCGA